MSIKKIIHKLLEKKNMTNIELDFIFNKIINGSFNSSIISEILTLININGLNYSSIFSITKILRKKMIKIKVPKNSLDTCGTGGDGKLSLNISTAVAILLASMKINVAKHGNKSITSKCGSADVLEQLGLNINEKKNILEKKIIKNNFIFLFAPNFHASMKNVALIRKKLAFKTIFNIIGPLLNPGSLKRQIIGLSDKTLLVPYITVLKKLKYKKAWVYCSEDGFDEISIFNKTKIYELNNNKIRSFYINPRNFIKNKHLANSIIGKNKKYNANKIIEIFKGKNNAFSDMVALNAAAGLIVADREKNINSAFQTAKLHLLSGNTYNKLKELRK